MNANPRIQQMQDDAVKIIDCIRCGRPGELTQYAGNQTQLGWAYSRLNDTDDRNQSFVLRTLELAHERLTRLSQPGKMLFHGTVLSQDAYRRTPLTWICKDNQNEEIRIEQAVVLKWWGIEFELDQPELTRKMAHHIEANAIAEYTKNVVTLARKRWTGRHLHIDKKGEPNQEAGGEFEQLIIGLLVQEQHRAKRATVFEDLLEKTDIRVNFEKLKRPKGARVQATRTHNQWDLDAKLHRIPDAEEIVVISPYTVAKYIAREYQKGNVRNSFWTAFPTQPASEQELARALRNIFENAQKNWGPSGPPGQIPKAITTLLGKYTQQEAFKTTALLRRREAENGRRPRARFTRRWTYNN